jgi:threonine/homoserine efflux transporter RhtA
VALSPMYPPREEAPEPQAPERRQPSWVFLAVIGLVWLTLAILYLRRHNIFAAVLRLELAVFWCLYAWTVKAQLKERDRRWIGVAALALFSITGLVAYLQS